MHQHRAHSHRRRIPAAVSVAVLVAGLATTLAAGTAAAGGTTLYVDATASGDACLVEAPCATLQEALAIAQVDPNVGTINVLSSLEVAQQVNVSIPNITIDGGGNTISTTLDNSTAKDPANNSVLGVQADDVSIKNLTINGSDGKNVRGINAYLAQNLGLTGVTVVGSDTIGLLVNGSTVTAVGLHVQGRVGAWGSVEVDPGAAVQDAPSTFDVDGTSVLSDATQIWSDGVNVNTNNAVTVKAPGYDAYHVNDTAGQPALRVWAKGPLARPGAYILGAGVREFYASVQSAVDAVPANGTVVVTGSPVLTSQVSVSKSITIDGGGLTIGTSLNNDNGTGKQLDANNNSVIGVQNVAGVTIKDLVIDASGGKNVRGINAYLAQGLSLTNVTINGSDRIGLLVNGSTVGASGLTVKGRAGAWGSVEVDPGSGVEVPSSFTIDSASVLSDATQIWSDGVNVTTGNAVTVNAGGYDVYHVNDTAGQPALRVWAKGPLDRPGAWFDNGSGREFYPTIQGALTNASNGPVYINAGTYNENVNVDKPLVVTGADGASTTGGTLTFNVTAPSGSVGIHRIAFTSPGGASISATNGASVDATYNYWGSAAPKFADLIEATPSSTVFRSPWYLDSTMQVSIDDETPRAQIDLTAGGGTASTSNIDTSGTNATATGASGTITMVALPTTTAGSDIPSTGSSTVPTKVVDLSVSAAAAIDSIDLKVCGIGAATELRWWNTKATPPAWQKVTPVTSAGDCLIAVITNSSSPSISELTGTVFAAVKIVSTPGGGAGGDGIGGDSGSTTPPSGSTSRIAGSNRYGTAALIAEQFINADSAYTGAVVLANGENFKQGLDALSANYLAGAQHAPILLTQAGALPAATVAGLRAVLTGQAGATIYVMGGVDSVSDAAVAQAKKIAETVTGGTVTVKRIAGADRYATSAASATSSGAVGTVTIGSGTGMRTVVLASGEVNADALAAGSLSFAAHLPVLLTQARSLPNPVQEAITKLGVKQVIVLGGTDRVSAAVVKSLAAIGVTSVTRIAGTDRFDTAARIYRFARSNASVGMDGSAVYLANGITGFPDALAVGPLAGATSSSVLTVTGTSLPGSTAKFLTSYKASVTSVVPLGASATVAQSVVDAATAALGGCVSEVSSWAGARSLDQGAGASPFRDRGARPWRGANA
jgi:putative cell wall-binding protein